MSGIDNHTEIKISAHSPQKKYEIIFALQKGKDVTLNSVIAILNGVPAYAMPRSGGELPYRNDNYNPDSADDGVLRLDKNDTIDTEPLTNPPPLDINNCWIRAMVSTLLILSRTTSSVLLVTNRKASLKLLSFL